MKSAWIALPNYSYFRNRALTKDRGRVKPELKKKGVYIHVFPGTPPRIIYIGTALGQHGFHVRLRNEIDEYFNRLGLVFKAKKTDDIYSKGMRITEGESFFKYIEDTVKPMASIKGAMKIWIPEKKAVSQNFFLRNDKNLWKEQDWKEFVEHEQPDTKIFGLETSIEEAKIIETRLQIALGEQFNIGFYKKISNQNWLGHQEARSELEEKAKKDRLKSLEPLEVNVDELRSADLREEDLRPLNDPENKRLILRHFDKLQQ